MKFLADENIPKASYNVLKDNEWDIIHIADDLSGLKDEEIVALSIEQRRIIITFDSDFGELIFKDGMCPLGCIFLRLKDFMPSYPAEVLIELMMEGEIEFSNYFTVIDDNQVRQRKIESPL